MGLVAGLATITDDFGQSWGEDCCDAWITHLEKTQDVMYDILVPQTTTTTDANGNTTSTTVLVTQQVTKSATFGSLQAACAGQATSQHASTTAQQTTAWTKNQTAWLDAYKEYQNCMVGPYILQLLANMATLCNSLEQQQEYQGCVNQMLAALKAASAQVTNEFLGEAGVLKGHVKEVSKGFATRMCNLDTKKQWHCNVADSVIDCYTNLYKKCEDDHWLNLCTHLAQICTNGRDASNAYNACLDTWKTDYKNTFDKWQNSTVAGEGGFAEICTTLGTMLNKADDILCTIEECGEALQQEYYDPANPGAGSRKKIDDFLCKVLDDINTTATDANGNSLNPLDQIKACADRTIQCFEDMKTLYEGDGSGTGYADCEKTLAPLVLGQAKCLFTDTAVTVPSAQAGNGDGMAGTATYQFNGSSFFKDCTAFLEQSVVDKLDVFTRYVGEMNAQGNSSGEHCLGRVIIDQACGLVNDLQAAVTFMDTHADNCIADYETVYHDKEHLLAQAVMQSACDLAACFKTVHQYLCDHADAMDQCFADGYATTEIIVEGNNNWVGGTEKGFASQMLAQADYLAEKHCGVFGWFTNCAFEAKMCWDDDYKDKIKTLDCNTLDCADQMVDCAKLAHQWLCDQADKLNDHWCDFYKPKEEEYVCAVLEKALELACESRDCLDDMCDKADEWCEWFKRCYEDSECLIAPKVIEAAESACQKNEYIFEQFCDRMDHMWDKWENNWCQCDLDDLAKHCEIWEKQNFLEEICDNSNCARDLAERMKDCYYDFLDCEKEYIELCVWKREKYDPKFCDLEDRAMLHIRKNFDMEREELLKYTNKFCIGTLQDQMKDLAAMKVKAEAATMSQANHWEKLWQTQEDDRLHRYHMESFQYVEGWADRSLNAYEQSTRGNDLILQRINERIVRGYQYLQTHSDFGQVALSGINQALTSALRMVDLGHFWPSHWLNTKNSFVDRSLNYLNVADDVLRIGQQHVTQSAQDKVQAAQIADAAVGRGQQAISHGHTILNLARQFEELGERTMNNAENNGLRAIDLGHYYQSQGANDKLNAAQVAQQATQNGLQTVGLGHDVKRMAVDASNQSGNLAANGVGLGLQSIDRGHWWAEQAREDKRLALDTANATTQHMFAGLQQGLANAGMALEYATQAKTTLDSKVDCAKDAAGFAFTEYQLATEKMNAAMGAAIEGLNQARDMYRVGRDRQTMIVDGYRANESAAIASVGQFQAGVSMGHNHLNRAAAYNAQTMACEKDMIDMACQMVRDYHFTSLKCLNGAVGSALGSASALASEQQAQAADAFGGLQGGFSGIASIPPAFTPATTGTGSSTPPSSTPPSPSSIYQYGGPSNGIFGVQGPIGP